jgi:uncharacterized protein
MDLQWNGQEQIAASKAAVWSFINDPANIAKCLPDLIDYHVKDAHNFDANVQVAVGPVRGKFKFSITLIPSKDESHMDLKISGGGFGSVVDLNAGADLAESGNETTLTWQGKATMRGPVATIGGRVLDQQAHRVIGTTFENVKNTVSAT